MKKIISILCALSMLLSLIVVAQASGARIEIDENLIEDEVVIHCVGISDEVTKVQRAISEVVNASQKLFASFSRKRRILTL